jgi:hypothetical protein
MEPIVELATGGNTTGTVRWEKYLEKDIEDYLESNSILRQFCYIYRLQNTFTANLPKANSTGLAVEIVEGAEIPAVRQVISTVDVKVAANGTAIEMTDEAKMVDWYGDLAERELEEAKRRMLRKENSDIMTTMLAGAATSTDSYDTSLGFDDITDAKTYLRKRLYNPTTVFVNPDEYSDLVKDDDFRDYSASNTTAPLREGTVGGRIAGLDIVEIPEITEGVVLVADMSVRPVWLVVLQELKAEAFRINDERTDKVQMWTYEKPAVLKTEAIRKINMKTS